MCPVIFAEQGHRIQHTQLRILRNTPITSPHSHPTLTSEIFLPKASLESRMPWRVLICENSGRRSATS